MKKNWEGGPFTIGRLTVGFNVAKHNSTVGDIRNCEVKSGIPITDSSESYGSGASLGLKLKCITAFVKLLAKKANPISGSLTSSQEQSLLCRNLYQPGKSIEYPLGKKSLGSGDFYDGMCCVIYNLNQHLIRG